MIELSITTRNATPSSPVTPVSGATPGGFARVLGVAADPSPRPPVAVEPRQRDAAGGKKLPVDAADPASGAPDAPVAVKGKPPAIRRHARPDVAPPPVLTTRPAEARDPGEGEAVGAKTPSHDDEATVPSTTISQAVLAGAPILIDPALLPVASRNVAPAVISGAAPQIAATLPPVSPAALPIAPATQPEALAPTVAVAPDALPGAPTPGRITMMLPGVELIDAGASPKTLDATLEVRSVTAPRLAMQADTQVFAITPLGAAGTPSMLPVQPARQAFAAALAALSARATTHDDDVNDLQTALPGFAAPVRDATLQAAVQQVADSAQGGLDPRHDRGLHGMIDHIEMLRDDANARDTRIRLSPDALGTVDVALHRDGDAVHVRFTAANEATRLVLSDAQPRLAALAEARGVRIAGSSIDGGSSGGSGQPQHQPRTEFTRPARASRGVAASNGDAVADQRLA